MNYLLKLIVFTVATLIACVMNDVINIKIERRIGIAKKPFLLFIRYLPGYLNFIPHIAILFVAVMFASQNMSSSFEYILLPLILIFITKVLFTKSNAHDIYLEAICTASIIICVLPVLLQYSTPSWLCLVTALISIKIFNKNTSEPLPLNMARNLALNLYVFYVWFHSINFYLCIIMAIVILYIQSILYTLVPRFNQTKSSKLVFVWSFLISLCAFLVTSILETFLSGVSY